MAQKGIPPSVKETAFECPHCGVYTTQTWYDLFAHNRGENDRIPTFYKPELLERIHKDDPHPPDSIVKYFEKAISGCVLIGFEKKDYYSSNNVINLHVSKCYDCEDFAVWVHDKLLFPESRQGPPPNPDMPVTVRMDYEEASKILNLSPRGAAALLRLAIQKLCKELGEKGDKINDDIASLVKKGLSPLIQEALDSVRVIGNEAVHPGTLDLRDDKDTANKLFLAVNIIVEQMISNPKHVKDLYDKIPPGKKTAIEERDKK